MAIARLAVPSVNVDFALKDKIYNALKQAIVSMNVDAYIEELRIDKRQLARDLGVSRTPHPRGDSSSGARGLRAHGAAKGRICCSQDQKANLGNDHGMGGARRHGRTFNHVER